MISASTKYHAITHISTGETFIRDICLSFISTGYLAEELEAETYLYLAELPEDKLLSLFNSKQIRYYCYGMIKNQIRSRSSKFYRTHLRPQILEDEFDSQHHTNYTINEDKNEKLGIINEAIDNLDFYRKELFQMYYFDNMSYMQISDYTASKNPILRIPKASIWNAVTSAREDVMNYIHENYPDMMDEMEQINI